MNNYKFHPLALAIAIAAMPVYAQDNQSGDNTVEEVVVTGSFRDSLKNALNLKRNSSASIDSIVAEDIGDFPDNNLADAMARVPGVNITRVGGEGAQINVRGLSADFSRVRVNGMETIAAGYNNKGRAFDFNIFASELFSRIDVRKTQTAEIEEGSLGATVDLFTARPLDSSESTYAVNYSQGFNDRSENSDPRISGLASIVNDDGTLGAAFSVAYSQRSLIQEGHNSGRWERLGDPATGNNRWKNAASLPAAVNYANIPRFPRQLDRSIDLDRLGVTGTFQWRPADETLFTFDAMHADLGYQQTDLTLTPISLARTGTTGRRETTVTDYYIDAATNSMQYATLSGVDVRSENAFVDADTSFDQFSLSGEHSFSDSVRLKALVGSSESKTELKEESTAILEKFNADFAYDYRGKAWNPSLTYNFDLKDPASWKISELRDRPGDTTNIYHVGQLDLAWDLNDVFTAKIGASVKKFEFENNKSARDKAIINQTAIPQGNSVSVPSGCGLTLANLSVDSSLGSLYTPSNGANTFFLPDMKKVADKVGFFSNTTCFPLTATAGEDRAVDELDSGQYVQLDFKTEVFNMEFTGDLGVRYVKTEQDARGLVSGADVIVSREYTDSLPALNLALQPVDDVMLRASWAKVMTRPGLGSLTPGGSVDRFNRAYTAGNPNLDPFRADALDVSVEWYFADESLVSLAWFEKDIESFPANISVNVPWTSLGLPDSLLSGGPATSSDIFNFKSTGNGEGGKLDGWELQYQQPFTFGPAWLQNFGIKANVTVIESKVNRGTAEAPVWRRLDGQSDDSYNGTLWYENESGFSGRISYTFRSDYQTNATTVLKDANPVLNSALPVGSDNSDDAGVVDASFSYQLNDNLKLTFDALNLTDEPETLLISDYGLVDTTLKSGRQYYVGAQYSF
ncbi:TonB-dependent receptor [Cellvibrio sp. KY-GH-1]|uniref:TonB-dependent receptor n=1 Tax=Cellvibrio sp. KY-GH-1 TaxID=2303332 RepID=UPI001246D132|nr:TonB-dependent receptor [Cellvibrio sp. KY-GH-1]QEY17777.1 TonB-dependent receptor [Cellvibrio sp. KY-GH-1]